VGIGARETAMSATATREIAENREANARDAALVFQQTKMTGLSQRKAAGAGVFSAEEAE
jgi:hypothetical protein